MKTLHNKRNILKQLLFSNKTKIKGSKYPNPKIFK